MNLSFEEGLRTIFSSNAHFIIGIDEVGLGAWAGPLVVAGVVLKKEWGDKEVKDSKSFTSSKTASAYERRRDVLNRVIRPEVLYEIVEHAQSNEIDREGISNVLERMTKRIASFCYGFYSDSIVVIDGNSKWDIKSVPDSNLIIMPKADTIVPAVSAASILAKVTRDFMMINLHGTFPEYGFNKHMGYGTKEHKKALDKLGICPHHRVSYAPIRNVMG